MLPAGIRSSLLWRMRWRSRAKPECPYNCRLIKMVLVPAPPLRPLWCGRVSAAVPTRMSKARASGERVHAGQPTISGFRKLRSLRGGSSHVHKTGVPLENRIRPVTCRSSVR